MLNHTNLSFPHWSLHMRTITTNEITDIVFLINKAKELKKAHSLSIRSLMHFQAQADTYYDLILSDAIVHQGNIIDPLEKACYIFDELVEKHLDTIKRSK